MSSTATLSTQGLPLKNAKERMDVISAYRDVGTYRGAAEICGTTHKTVRRIIAAARSDRFVAMPAWLTARLRDRAQRFGTQGLVFPTPGRWGTGSREKERDRRNVTRHLRVILNDAGMPWATAHTFRTTVGDLVTKGVNGTEASNILGHARASMTYDRYSDRRQRPTGAVEVLGDVAS